jgi:hypothetical protein
VSERLDGGESVAEGFGFFVDQFSIEPDGFVAEGECGDAVGAEGLPDIDGGPERSRQGRKVAGTVRFG